MQASNPNDLIPFPLEFEYTCTLNTLPNSSSSNSQSNSIQPVEQKQNKFIHLYSGTSSIGGGLSVGYRTYISKNKRWKMEFSVGGGYYDSKYDKFRNEENGFLIGSYEKQWIGVDQVAVSFAYTFNLKKKGDNR